MTKRKRSIEDAVQKKLEKYRIDIFRAISSAKAAERKRFGSRLREPGVTPQKKARLQKEHDVLKALDLRLVARNHLHSNLLRIKALEASDHLPAELRAGVPKPTLSEQDILIHNNVISMLCNTVPAKQALDRAVADICETLEIPVAEKSKRFRKNKRKDAEGQPSDTMADHEPEQGEGGEDEGSEWAGVSDEGGSSDEDDTTKRDGLDGLDEFEEEGAISKYDDLLGGSSDEDDELDDELLAKYRGREQVDLDDISLGSASEIDVSDAEDEPQLLPPPKTTKEKPGRDETAKESREAEKAQEKETKKVAKSTKAAKAADKATKAGNSAFLPTLMGGYISGSESASDIDAPPKKKRRGQRDRQAIWEKKYGANANHLKKAATKGGRDAGWDMKRGAVGAGDRAKGRWKKGGQGPPNRDRREVAERRAPEAKPTKKDDEGPLHPSWEARKKAKDAVKSAAFAGSKIVFD